MAIRSNRGWYRTGSGWVELTLLVAVLGFVTACKRSAPTIQGDTTPVVRLEVTGPQTPAPATFVAYTATAYRASGTSSDVTRLAAWNVTDLSSAGVLNRQEAPGTVITGRQIGFGVLTATFEGVTGELKVS